MHPSEYSICVEVDDGSTILINGISGAVDLLDSETYGAFKDGKLDAFPASIIATLMGRGHITDKSRTEEKAELARYAGIMNSKGIPIAHYLFIPSYDCNFRCDYCYQSLYKKKSFAWLESRMTAEMVQSAFRLIDSQKAESSRPLPRVITFYGGEPFMPRNRAIIEQVVALGKERDIGFEAITNGSYLDQYGDLFAQGGFREIKLTLDGIGPDHDSRRYMAGGKPSFDIIIAAVDKILPILKEEKTRLSVRVNIDVRNVKGVRELDLFFEKKGYKEYEGFGYYISPVIGEGLKNSYEDLSVSEFSEVLKKDDFLKGVRNNRTFNPIIKRQFLSIFKDGSLPAYQIRWCGANGGMIVFDPFGNLYSCWDVVGTDEGVLGSYHPGMEWDEKVLGQWFGRSILSIPQCLECPYAFYCGGGCQRAALKKAGSYLSPDCKDFVESFENSVRAAYRDYQGSVAGA